MTQMNMPLSMLMQVLMGQVSAPKTPADSDEMTRDDDRELKDLEMNPRTGPQLDRLMELQGKQRRQRQKAATAQQRRVAGYGTSRGEMNQTEDAIRKQQRKDEQLREQAGRVVNNWAGSGLSAPGDEVFERAGTSRDKVRARQLESQAARLEQLADKKDESPGGEPGYSEIRATEDGPLVYKSKWNTEKGQGYSTGGVLSQMMRAEELRAKAKRLREQAERHLERA